MIKERGKIHLDEIHVNNGHVWFKGVLEFDILYRTDLDNRKINSLNGEISFQESLSIDGTEELDPVKVEGRIEDISVSVINSRKLGIRSLVEFILLQTPSAMPMSTPPASIMRRLRNTAAAWRPQKSGSGRIEA